MSLIRIKPDSSKNMNQDGTLSNMFFYIYAQHGKQWVPLVLENGRSSFLTAAERDKHLQELIASKRFKR